MNNNLDIQGSLEWNEHICRSHVHRVNSIKIEISVTFMYTDKYPMIFKCY